MYRPATVLAGGGSNCDGGGLDDGNVAAGAAERGFEADILQARGALAGLDRQGSGALEGGGQDDVPLSLKPVGALGNDLEKEEG